MNVDTVTVLAVASGVIHSGAIGWLTRQAAIISKRNADVASLKVSNGELSKRVNQLEKDYLLHNSIIEDVRHKLNKLDKLDELCITVKYIKEQMSNFVTRVELDARVGAVEKFVEKQ
jgi:hypothetical protein